ncbi:MAG: M48 family metallopeptidase [Candidatus Saccharimonadales bacterium]
MAVLKDEEFGTITIRTSKLSRSVKVSVAPDGGIRITMPLRTPLFIAKHFIASSRDSIRELLIKGEESMGYQDGMQIGKSHSLHISTGPSSTVHTHDRRIHVALAANETLHTHLIRQQVRQAVIAALRKEAKSYLPKRLTYLATQYGFQYKSVRFSHASSRWGSCSSIGTISLNIALMKLPFNLIDYVLIHELCHTKEMNHSEDFWTLVQAHDPIYKTHRNALKTHNPMVL